MVHVNVFQAEHSTTLIRNDLRQDDAHTTTQTLPVDQATVLHEHARKHDEKQRQSGAEVANDDVYGVNAVQQGADDGEDEEEPAQVLPLCALSESSSDQRSAKYCSKVGKVLVVIADGVLSPREEVAISYGAQESSEANEGEAEHPEPSEGRVPPGLMTDLVHSHRSSNEGAQTENDI